MEKFVHVSKIEERKEDQHRSNELGQSSPAWFIVAKLLPVVVMAHRAVEFPIPRDWFIIVPFQMSVIVVFVGITMKFVKWLQFWVVTGTVPIRFVGFIILRQEAVFFGHRFTLSRSGGVRSGFPICVPV